MLQAKRWHAEHLAKNSNHCYTDLKLSCLRHNGNGRATACPRVRVRVMFRVRVRVIRSRQRGGMLSAWGKMPSAWGKIATTVIQT